VTSRDEAPVFSPEFRSELEDLLHWRRDVRRFAARQVDDDLLQHLIDLTGAAPSVGFSQPARFVRVSNPDRRASVIDEYERCNADALATYSGAQARLYAELKLAGLREAPVHLAVFADEETQRGSGLGRQTMPETIAYSAVTAVHTLWLAARAYGVGVGWVSILEASRLNALLDVPQTWRFIAYLCIGYPLEEHADRELERAGWETSDNAAQLIVER
jgi:5,6-dimethylbenzimidazole synthase